MCFDFGEQILDNLLNLLSKQCFYSQIWHCLCNLLTYGTVLIRHPYLCCTIFFTRKSIFSVSRYGAFEELVFNLRSTLWSIFPLPLLHYQPKSGKDITLFQLHFPTTIQTLEKEHKFSFSKSKRIILPTSSLPPSSRHPNSLNVLHHENPMYIMKKNPAVLFWLEAHGGAFCLLVSEVLCFKLLSPNGIPVFKKFRHF